MQNYKSLNLKKVRDDNGLDFAHFTYLKNQCSCCYGPADLPARYWAGGKRPEKVTDNTQYILFKNASNGSGWVTQNDTICRVPAHIEKLKHSWFRAGHTEPVYIEWQFPMEKMDGVARSLKEQLDEDYLVLKPTDTWDCIVIIMVKDFNAFSKEWEKYVVTE